MNKGDSLEGHDFVSRGCYRAYRKGKIRSSAFETRVVDENCLSVDWVECKYTNECERCVEGTIRRQASRLTKRPQKLVILNVEKIRAITCDKIFLDVIYFPTGKGKRRNKCHCRIKGLTGGPTDQDIQQDLADLANRSQIVDLPQL